MITYNYYTKTLAILVVVFVILKYVINVHLYDAILLTCIIVTSYLIIEKVLSLNSTVSNPANCDQCTISPKKENFKGYNENEGIDYSTNNAYNQIASNPNAYAPTTINPINPITPTNQSAPIINPIQFNMQPNDPPLHLLQPKPADMSVGLFPEPTINSYYPPMPDSDGINTLKQFGPEILKQIIKSMPMIIDSLKSIPMFSKYLPMLSLLESPELLMTNPKVMEFVQLLENSFKSPQSLMENPKIMDGLNMLQQLFQNQQYNNTNYNTNYNAYDVNLYRLSEGEKTLVEPYLKDGNNYYNDIFTRSNPDNQKFDMNTELKYGDFNYIAPLNKGMANRDYTFISPNNWFPVAPVPPVCVTNKNCTTNPVMISDGKDYMAWADINDFDKSRRFTGNMGINLDYVKNVLNDSNGY